MAASMVATPDAETAWEAARARFQACTPAFVSKPLLAWIGGFGPQSKSKWKGRTVTTVSNETSSKATDRVCQCGYRGPARSTATTVAMPGMDLEATTFRVSRSTLLAALLVTVAILSLGAAAEAHHGKSANEIAK